MGNRVERVRTNISEPQMAQAMIEAWRSLFGTQPSKEQVSMLLAQNALETGHRKSMWNYNIGNITTNGKEKFDYFDDLKTNEQVSPGVWKKMNLKYRAYPTLKDGVEDYIKLLSNAPRYAKAWKSVLHPDPAAFSKALKDAGYYTADEAPYTKTLSGLYSQFNKSDSFDKAMSGKVAPPDKTQTQVATNNKGSIWDNLRKMLDSYLGALANNHQVQKKYLDKNEYLIKVNSNDLINSIEYSRILCESLEEELSSRTYIHSNGSNVEIDCKVYGNSLLCKKAVNALCNEVANAFKHATKGIEVETKIITNAQSQLEYLDDKLASSSYRRFRLNLLSKQD